ICFDRAASYYDKTRALGPEAAHAINEQLRSEIQGRRCLEIGVGTGRIGLPLAAAGVDLVGLDLSAAMLDRLRDHAGGSAPFPLIRGDATRLPFKGRSFEAGIASWVLHLIAAWRSAARELVRVVAPRGVVLVDFGTWRRSISSDIKWRFRDEAGVTDWPRGPKDRDELDGYMAELGATARTLDPVVDQSRGTLEDEIKALEDGIFSVTWGVDPTTRKQAADATRRWAEETFGSLTDERVLDATYEWRVYDLS
ncbi:MAG: class I SAM-dependent methyltransferase, partial [Actinomycetota bacterium]|nr:class I SAM-dependent methyltransferase [Actinomycetota bacterium]